MKKILLTRGYVALVDDSDYERVAAMKWQSDIRRWNNKILVYASHAIRIEGRYRKIRLHSFILGTKERIDHRDGDGLNNQRDNLRLASHSQNMMNREKFAGSSSQFKGVWWNSRLGKWRAVLMNSRTRKHLGYFSSEVDAATAYNFAAYESYGEFARLNLPSQQ